jgi:hypothetical protein
MLADYITFVSTSLSLVVAFFLTTTITKQNERKYTTQGTGKIMSLLFCFSLKQKKQPFEK